LTVEQTRETTVVRFAGGDTILDGEQLPAVADHLFWVAETSGCRRLVLDLAAVVFLFSDVLGMLVALHKRLRSAGAHLTLCHVRPELYEVFATTQLDRLLDVRTGGFTAGC
jgi:anti-sigma B factor antagonist